jgi:hypothetical protein
MANAEKEQKIMTKLRLELRTLSVYIGMLRTWTRLDFIEDGLDRIAETHT